MQIFVRGAAELIPLELENQDTVHDIRVSAASAESVSIGMALLYSCRNMLPKRTTWKWARSFLVSTEHP